MSQTLYLLRHAKAVPWGYSDDFNRELAPRGQKHMARLAGWLEANLAPPELELCSSSARTRETLAPLLERWPVAENRISYTDAVYHASAGMLHSLAEEAFESVDSLLMVGHNPGFESMAFHFMNPAETRAIYKMATGTLGVFRFPDGYSVDAGNVELVHWKTRKNLSDD